MRRRRRIQWWIGLLIAGLFASPVMAQDSVSSERLRGLSYLNFVPAEIRIARPAPAGMDMVVVECLRNASDLQAARVGPGVAFSQIDVPAASHACEAALKVAPDNLDVQTVLARVYLAGKLYKQAEDLLNESAAKGSTLALYVLAEMNLLPKFQGGSKEKYLELMEQAASLGDTLAMTELGTSYQYGIVVTKNVFKAETYLQDAASRGDERAIQNLIRLYISEPSLQLNRNSFTVLSDYMQRGNLQAQLGIALHYLAAITVGRDDEKAAELVMDAAKRGSIDAMVLLGSMYQVGRGVDQDYGEAVKQYRAAAGLGDPVASYFAGVAFFLGLGNGRTRVNEDPALAHTYFMQAAELGYGAAFTALGQQYLQGKGVEKDRKKSRYWYHKAANTGEPGGLNYVGIEYIRNDDLEKKKIGIQLLKKAAAAGSSLAAHNLELFCGKDVDTCILPRTSSVIWPQQ